MAPSVDVLRRGSGTRVARWFGRLLALTMLVAWLSLGAQVDVLFGHRGLLPAAPFAESIRSADIPYWVAPTIFRWGASDAALSGGIVAGALLSIAALVGIAPRLCFALGTLLYLSYATIGRVFLSFQWDNLLLEAGLLAVLLPRDRRSRLAHVALRILLFKLYFESGLAKWGSPLHDWRDGSAMTFYYETAPIPTALAWYAHQLPAAWHALEGWLTLVLELVVPFAIFGPRRARLFAAAALTAFQLINIATANYGYFAYLAIALHVFLLDDADVQRVVSRVVSRSGGRPHLRRLRVRMRWLALAQRRWIEPLIARSKGALGARKALGGAALGAYVVLSLESGAIHFAGAGPGDVPGASLFELVSSFRVVNTYHLFAAITRERIEPELETRDAEEGEWVAHDLRYKPGDVRRAPPIVAPHQPRVDFQLWFVGLGYRGRVPVWVDRMMHLACTDPDAVRPLFAAALPRGSRFVRTAWYRYRFTSLEERRGTGAYWKRELLGATPPFACP